MWKRETDWLQVFRSSYDGRWYWNRRTKDWRVAGTTRRSFESRTAAARNARRANPGLDLERPPARRARARSSA